MIKQVAIVAGVPRSGTSWLGEILDSCPEIAYRFQPLFSYAFKDAVGMDSSREEFEAFFKAIYMSNDNFLHQKDKRDAGLYPTFAKAHSVSSLAFKTCRYQYVVPQMLRLFDTVKVLGIVRNPCGVINSWLRNKKEFPTNADPGKEWRFGACKNKGRSEEFFGYMKWKEVAHLYLDLKDKYPNQVYVVKYEELVDCTERIAQDIFEFLKLEFSEQTKEFLQSCHAKHQDSPYSVFKDRSVKSLWKAQLDPSIIEEIYEDLRGTRLEGFVT